MFGEWHAHRTKNVGQWHLCSFRNWGEGVHCSHYSILNFPSLTRSPYTLQLQAKVTTLVTLSLSDCWTYFRLTYALNVCRWTLNTQQSIIQTCMKILFQPIRTCVIFFFFIKRVPFPLFDEIAYFLNNLGTKQTHPFPTPTLRLCVSALFFNDRTNAILTVWLIIYKFAINFQVCLVRGPGNICRYFIFWNKDVIRQLHVSRVSNYGVFLKEKVIFLFCNYFITLRE